MSSSTQVGASGHEDPKPPKASGMRLEDLFKLMGAASPAPQKHKPMEEHKFWKTQPVSAFDSKVDVEGPIDEGKIVTDVPQAPQALLDEFEWSTVDITDSDQVDEVYQLLYNNYIEDEDESFRFKYSADFLRWALQCPGWQPEWSVGVRVRSTNKLIAFIAGTPARLRLRDNKPIDSVEINFLCIHKKLRSKRLAPVLIREVTRLVNLKGTWQALYTDGVVLQSPITTCRYYHSSLNWSKLYEVVFSSLPHKSTPARQVAKNALPSKQTLMELRPMQTADAPQVHALLTKYLDRFDLAPIFTLEEMTHWLIDPHPGTPQQVVYSYVVEQDSKITDLVSFYGLESSVLGNAKYEAIKVAYAFYYATTATEESILKKRLSLLFQNALILAKNFGYDVFNALSAQDNPLFLEDLKFGAGDGFLHYYLFNYKAFPIHGGINDKMNLEIKREEGKSSGIGVVLL
jgi:glycylpeptide N-tetradecanoyltransferase